MLHAPVIKMYMLTTYTSIPRYANYKNMWTCIQRDTCISVYIQKRAYVRINVQSSDTYMFTNTEINVYIHMYIFIQNTKLHS